MDDRRSEEQNIWPDHLDAMTAAPDHHKILLENDRVRVLYSRVKPGDATPVHTHRWPAVLQILSTSNFIRYDANGDVLFDSRESDSTLEDGQTVWSQPLSPHFVENIGDREIRVISIEIKE